MKEGKDLSVFKKVNISSKNKVLVNILTSKLLSCLVMIIMVIILLNTKGIYSYYTDKETTQNTFTVESHTITYNYYVVSCSGNSVQMERTETRKGYTGTSIILGADETLMISDNNNTYYKMDFKISGTKYERNSEYIMTNSDVTIEQYYYLTKYTVTFDTNSLVDPIPTREISDGETYGTLPDISKTGYTFYGWYKESTFENQVTSSTVFTELTDMTLYAKLLPNEYSIIFDANTGTGNMPTQTFRYNEAQNLSQNTFTKDGYTFTGWNLAADGSDTSFINREQILNMTETDGDEFTLYAQWRANNYTVTFDANNGVLPQYSNAATTTKQVTYDSAYGELPTATRTGYTFGGWKTANNLISTSDWEIGGIGSTNGVLVDNNRRIRTKDYLKVSPSTEYIINVNDSQSVQIRVIVFYDDSLNYISSLDLGGWGFNNETYTTPSNCTYIKVSLINNNNTEQRSRNRARGFIRCRVTVIRKSNITNTCNASSKSYFNSTMDTKYISNCI